MSALLGEQCLRDFLAKASSSISEGGFAGFSRAVSAKKISLTYPLDLKKTEEDLKGLASLLDKLSSIVYRPHLSVKNEDVILRSEQAGSLGEDSIRLTINDSALWKKKKGQLEPEYVYSLENSDEIVTYENRFIALLIERSKRECQDLLRSYAPFEKSVAQAFDGAPASYSSYGVYGDLESFGTPSKGLLLEEEGEGSSLALTLRKAYRKCQSLEESYFYRTMAAHPFVGEVTPTNVLMHDPLYNAAYRYYRSHYAKLGHEGSSEELYRNYAYLRFFLCLGEENRGVLQGLSLTDGHLSVKPFAYETDSFRLSFDYEENGVALSIEATWKAVPGLSAHYRIIPVLSLEEETKQNLLNETRRLGLPYDEVIFITAFNHSKTSANVAALSPFASLKESQDSLLRLFNSLQTLVSASHRLYATQCPICGEEKVYEKDGVYQCAHCASRYVMGFTKKHETLWLLKIGGAK